MEKMLVVINARDNDLFAMIAFRRQLTEADRSIESIREQFDYIKFGRQTWGGPIVTETKDWYDPFYQTDGIQLEFTYDKHPPSIFTPNTQRGDIQKLRLFFETTIYHFKEGLCPFTAYIDINMSVLLQE
jgi:hypothetical protein